MRMPDGDMKADGLLDSFGEYLSARLGAKKDLKELSGLFQGAQDALRKKLETEQAMERAVQHAQAGRDEADQILDGKVRDLYLAIQMGWKTKRTNPLNLKYFPNGLSAVTLAPLTEELIAVGRILDLLASEENAAVRAFGPAVQETATGLQGAMAGHDAALKAAGFAANATRAQAFLWRDVYRKIYGQLIAIYSGDKAYTESFFKKGAKAKKGNGHATGGASTPKPPETKG